MRQRHGCGIKDHDPLLSVRALSLSLSLSLSLPFLPFFSFPFFFTLLPTFTHIFTLSCLLFPSTLLLSLLLLRSHAHKNSCTTGTPFLLHSLVPLLAQNALYSTQHVPYFFTPPPPTHTAQPSVFSLSTHTRSRYLNFPFSCCSLQILSSCCLSSVVVFAFLDTLIPKLPTAAFRSELPATSEKMTRQPEIAKLEAILFDAPTIAAGLPLTSTPQVPPHTE
ncbi:hypothetical protein BKA57DRAFT_221515 [Linnemannia elongata]|nr:hypothetical protein BKA57DRAFT_221515 [Linnemannia elongata]